mmetsp:Transcript_8756/g.14903  ORF Transcript_8756/g.14903 Transcript_8756/m.14903 type:complete len:145 (-) Transcript_8756:227-661(-)
MTCTNESHSYKLTNSGIATNHSDDHNPEFFHKFQRTRSVSFFDIDKVHYYNSDECSLTCSASSSDDEETTQAQDFDSVRKYMTTLIDEKPISEREAGPYFRVDLTYKIPCQHLEKLQDYFNSDIDLVGEFFEGVFMYELWKRKK